MKFVWREEVLKQLVEEVNLAYPAYHFVWETYAIGTVQEGRYGAAPILLVDGDAHLAIIRTELFDVSKISEVDILAKSDIQGLKFRKGWLNFVLKIRMANGEYYTYLFNKRSGGKHCPRHRDNVARYHEIFMREFSDRIDMKDRSLSLGWKAVMAFGWLLAIGVAVVVGIQTGSKFFITISFIGTYMAYAAVMSLVETKIAQRKDKSHYLQMQELKQRAGTLAPQEVYEALLAIQDKPTTELYQISYYEQLITLAHQLGYSEDAKHYMTLFPRRYSKGAEECYQKLENLLATPAEAETTQEEIITN